MAICLFSCPKNQSHSACHTHQSLTHSQCLESWTQQAFRFHAHNPLSFGVAMAQISNSQFYHPSKNGPLNAKKCHTPYGGPATHPVAPTQVQLGGRLHPKAGMKLPYSGLILLGFNFVFSC